MALETTVNRIFHVGNGITFSFPYDFRVDRIEDMNVFFDQELIDSGLYTVTDIGNDNGGSVIMVDPQDAPAAGVSVALVRVVEPTQQLVYPDYGPFPAKSHEAGLDKLTMLFQQVANNQVNSLRVPISDPPDINKLIPGVAERSERYIFFDVNGNLVMSIGTVQDAVQAIRVIPGSQTMLEVDNDTNPEQPGIGVNNINGEAGLMKLTAQGDYPQFPNLPGGGLPIEVLSNTPFLLFAVLIDDGTFNPGTDSQEMLTTYRQSNPDDPFGFVDVLGVNTPNQALRLVQTDEFGQIPPSLLRFQGLRNRGIFRGDDLCDKPGDGVGDCTAPDTRNPSERFPILDYPPGTDPETLVGAQWRAGDFFAITMAAGESDGTMNLFTELGQVAPSVITVEANDGVTFIPEVRRPEAPFDILVHHGWYHQPDRFNLTTANLVSLNTAGYEFIGPLPNDDVQQAFDFLDNALGQFRADQSSFDTSGGTIIIAPGSINVQLALLDLDAGALSKVLGGTVTGDIYVRHGDSPSINIQIEAVDGFPSYRILDIAGAIRAQLVFVESSGEVAFRRRDAAGALQTSLSLSANGNASVDGSAPTAGDHLTRMDWVQAADAVVRAVADAALAAAGVAQSAAEAANANANTRKLEFDFIRSGDRLDINNVRTS